MYDMQTILLVDFNLVKHELADVWIMRSNEIGVTDNQLHTKTHLGHLLNIGDLCLG
jgi:nonsense-mediated mRNA decay protein 3